MITTTPIPIKPSIFFKSIACLQHANEGGCIDGGMKIFDPIAWYTDRGRFYLVARKGHETRLAPDKDGIFQKDPPTGAQLFLKKQ